MNTRRPEAAAWPTAYDWGWATGGAINRHVFDSPARIATGRQWERLTLEADPDVVHHEVTLHRKI